MRLIGDLTFQDVPRRLRATSILCLPMGSMEQHGPHLPLNTDAVLAEAFTRAIIERFGETLDLWQMPALPVGVSREHAWAPGTLSFSVGTVAVLLRELAREISRALPAKNLVVVNAHGGNRGILEAMVRELAADFGLNLCALHLGPLISPVTDAAVPEIHGGRDETSAMLALAPGLVRRERMGDLKSPPDGGAIRSLILDPAVSWPWSSSDKRIADTGIIGDPAGASVEHGRVIVERVLAAAEAVLRRLLENQARP